MFRRSRAREVAVQLLFQQDQNKKPMPPAAVRAFAADRLTGDDTAITFCLALFDGVNAHRDAIDKTVAATADNWRLHRMMPSDRNVLRLGTYELLHAPAAEPVPVILNEAIELARRFGTADSPAFVNGLLDKIAKARSAESPVRNAELGMRNEETAAPEVPPPNPEPSAPES